jgi:hypothetical protein
MSERASQLHATADAQLDELIKLISSTDRSVLNQRCPGRERLGDGTIGALAAHTADNYQRIAIFVATGDHSSGGATGTRSRRRAPRFARVLGHRPPSHARHSPGTHGNHEDYSADSAGPGELVDQLSVARQGLERIAALTRNQLESTSPKDSLRFCDGQATLSRS